MITGVNNGNRYKVTLVSFILLTLLTFNHWPDWAKTLSFRFTDMQVSVLHHYGYQQEIDERVVVLEVDDRSIDDIGRWPWHRTIIADLFNKLSSASIVVADIVFSEKASLQEDQILAQTLRDNDNVILGFFLRDNSGNKTANDSYQHIESCALQRVELRSEFVNLFAVKDAEVNIPLLSDAALSCALFTITSDPDGIYRHYPLLYVHKDLVIPTLALQAYQFDSDQELSAILDENGIQSIQGKNLSIERQNTLLINFPRQIITVSATDVLSGKVPASYFDDKVVMIGLSEIGLFDIRPTNLNPYTPGVHLHAAALSNMMHDNWYQYAPNASLVITLFTLLCFIAIAKWIKSDTGRWLIYLSFYGGGFILSAAALYLLNTVILTFELFFYTLVLLFLIEGRKLILVQRQKLVLRSAFSSYVVPDVVKMIEQQGVSGIQDGMLKDVNVMFSDIQNFTNMAEALAPQQVISLLNTVFNPITQCIVHNQGTLDKYIGDEVMAFFNAPAEVENYHDKSVLSAIEIQQSLTKTNKTLSKARLPNVSLSLGIAHGPVVVGDMGSEFRRNYTAVGNTVNLAARLTSLSKKYGQQIIITEDIYNAVNNEIKAQFNLIDRIIVKGKSTETVIYGLQDVNVPLSAEIEHAYVDAFNHYQHGRFAYARGLFFELANKNVKAAAIMAKRCQSFMDKPPHNWDGIYQFDKK